MESHVSPDWKCFSMLFINSCDCANQFVVLGLFGRTNFCVLTGQFKIRREAVLGLGGIYKTVYSRDPVDPQQAARVDWIRNKVFHHYYQNSNDDR